MKYSIAFVSIFLLAAIVGYVFSSGASPDKNKKDHMKSKVDTKTTEKVTRTDKEWKSILTPEQYYVCRQQGTERAFTGKYYNHKGKGTYICVACKNTLFRSEDKFDSGTGWPSFIRSITSDAVDVNKDATFGMTRWEIVCHRCNSHLGHVFDDGPLPTGKRFCINSVSLTFNDSNGR